MSAVWTFEQLDGPPSQRKTLTLEGWNAPFGRPRKSPVIKETIKSRIQTTRYPGSNTQTRHAFGTNWESTELRGRWMTKSTGTPADDIATEWTNFLRDERTVRIAWGFILSFKGYLEELELERESENEIAWRMVLQIDQRDDIENRTAIQIKNTRLDNSELARINAWVQKGLKVPAKVDTDVGVDFGTNLALAIGALNFPAATLNNLAGRFDDLEKATFSTIQNARGAITGFRTAALTVRETVLNADADLITFSRSADFDVAWSKYQASVDNSASLVLADLAAMDRRLELVTQSKTNARYVRAVDGDTWESLSSRAFGSADKAASIRSLAGAQYGARPIPGESYLVF